jgi:2-polyprenyl-3-methyl-5-hydroxy-6-metoxy-1,4-benzoquinol methylase
MIYRRRFDPQGEDSLAKLARWIAPGTRVLELGAAAGYFTAHLASIGCTVDVVEIDEQAAAEASMHARHTVVADLDGDAWLRQLPPERYGAIVCADVLEHLRDGRRLLRRLLPLLNDDGALLVSVPNAAHSAIVAGLLDEHLEYGAEGLLDDTHLHLYTWRSLRAALDDAGYRIAAWDATLLAPFETEFRTRVEGLAPPMREVLERRPRAFVYQWLVRALPGRGPHAEPPEIAGAATVGVRLLTAERETSLSLERAMSGAMPLGGVATNLSWRLPEATGALRLMPADRSGVVELVQFALMRGDAPLWSLQSPADVATSSGVVHVGDRRYALASGEEWITFAAPPSAMAAADGVEVTLAWLSGVAEQGLHGGFEAMARALHRERDEAQRRIAALEMREATLAYELQALAARSKDREADLQAQIAAVAGEQARLEGVVKSQERIISYRQSARWWVRLPFVRMRLAWRRLAGS